MEFGCFFDEVLHSRDELLPESYAPVFQEIRFIIVHGTDIEKLVEKIKSHGGSPFCNSGLSHQSIGMRITHKYCIKNRYIARNMEIRLKYK